MSGERDGSDALPPGTSATEALENAVEESRREYDKKVETMEEIDDKAMRSVRTAVILVGLVVSAVSVSGPGAVGEVSILPTFIGGFGVVSLVTSIVSGIGAYSTTEYPTGISSNHRADVILGGYSGEEWFTYLLTEYDEWSGKIDEELSEVLQYLELVQVSLSLGVVSLLASASMIVLKRAYGIQPSYTLAVVATLSLAFRSYLSKND